MSGYVYVIKMGDAIKIGASRKPKSRIDALKRIFKRDIEVTYISEPLVDYFAVERAVHRALAEHRINGEWFILPVPDAIKCIATHKDENKKRDGMVGITVKLSPKEKDDFKAACKANDTDMNKYLVMQAKKFVLNNKRKS